MTTMTRRRPTPKSVWVPFEKLPDGSDRKCIDLPRFPTRLEVWKFLNANGQKMLDRLLEWREHREREYIEEYLEGIGETTFILRI